MDKAATTTTNLEPLSRPHNYYNVYFILERERLLQEKATGAIVSRRRDQNSSFDLAASGYDSMDLPDLPPRYQGLSLENGWYVPGRNAGRKHVKTHGSE